MRRIFTVAVAALLTIVLAVPAAAHPQRTSDATSNSRRDHFVEHLFHAELRIDPNFVDRPLMQFLMNTTFLAAGDFDNDFADDGNADGDFDRQRRFCVRGFWQRPAPGPPVFVRRGVLTDLNQVDAQLDLDTDGDVDSDDDELLTAAICYYFIKDVVRGQNNGTFGERRATRRDQGASLVARWVDLNNDGFPFVRDGDFPEHRSTDYPDVSQINAHSGAIWWLSDGGGGFTPPIFNGYTDGTFKPARFLWNQHGGFIEERLADNFGG